MNKQLLSPSIITTSRNPMQTMRTLCNDLAFSLPNTKRINRGKSGLHNLAERVFLQKAEKIIILERWKSGFGKVRFLTIENMGLVEFPPIIFMQSVKLRRTFSSAKSTTAKLIILQAEPRTPSEAWKLLDTLSQFLNIPRITSDEILPIKRQTAMHISSNSQDRIQITFIQPPRNIEVGPQITISHLKWKL